MGEEKDVGSSFVHEEQVRWVDLDAAGVVNNAVYLTFVEQARFAYFARLGLGGATFLLGETRVRYLRPVQNLAKLGIAARVSRLGRKSFDMEYEVILGAEPVALAWATLVWVDDQLASTEIPALVRSRLAAFEGIAELDAGPANQAP